MRLWRLISLCAVLAAPCAWPQGIQQYLGVRVRMRDGVELSANVFLPPGGGRVPVILVRTPYGKGKSLSGAYRPFVNAGYAVVIQDVRGRGDSEGVFRRLDQEVADGHDTLDWIGSQPWSNDRIGMIGGSYLGIVQWKAALAGSPFLKAISPVVSGSDEYEDRFYSKGGAMKLGHRLLWFAQNLRAPEFPIPDFGNYVWNRPLRTSDRAAAGQTLDVFQEALDHPAYDAYWRSVSTREQLERVRIPVLAFGGWYDNFVENDLEAFRRLREMSREARIVVGPWPHNQSADFPGFDFGQEADLVIRGVQLEWFDYWLKSPPAGAPEPPPGPRARLFLMGANRWKTADAWPPDSESKTLYLAGDGRLLERAPVESKPQSYSYDPRNPVPTMGGAVCCTPKIFPWGPMDQRPVENRPDVLVYTTAPLDRDTEVTGAVRAVLWVSTNAPDTDFTAKLSEVYPDGRSVNLCDGILRLRYRDSLERPTLVRPGAVYRITIQAGVTSNLFRKGRRIRLDVSSSNFPRFDRNPNTGRAIADEKNSRVARQTVYHDARRPSQLVLPVVR